MSSGGEEKKFLGNFLVSLAALQVFDSSRIAIGSSFLLPISLTS